MVKAGRMLWAVYVSKMPENNLAKLVYAKGSVGLFFPSSKVWNTNNGYRYLHVSEIMVNNKVAVQT